MEARSEKQLASVVDGSVSQERFGAPPSTPLLAPMRSPSEKQFPTSISYQLISLVAVLALTPVSASAGQPPQVVLPFAPVVVAQGTNGLVSVELPRHFTDPDVGDVLSYSVRIATPTGHLPDRVSEARYRTVHQELLYTHTGQSRSRNSPQRIKARNNLAAQFGCLGLTVTREPFQYKGTLHNLVAEKRGVVRPDDIYVVGAHLDSYSDNCPGADDDASGLAALLEIATALQPYSCAATIRFVVFDAEENEMQGSLAYAAEHVPHERILGMINLESMAYNPPGATHDVVKVATMRDPNDASLQAALLDAFNAQGFGRGVVADADQENGADSLPFALLGVPSVVVYEPNATEGSYYHSPTDAVETPGLMDYAHCAKVSGGVAGALAGLAGLTGAPNAVSHTFDGSALVLSFVSGQYGVAEVTVRATDPGGLYAEATFRVTVTPVNHAPVARNDVAVVPANGVLAIDVLANDEDADLGEVLTITTVSSPTAGTAVTNADRRVVYTPPNGFTGAASFTYTVRDITGVASSAATVQLIVRTNTAPTAVADAYTVNEDEILRREAPVGVLANDSDADGDALGAVLVQGPAHGVLTLEPNGAFTYRGAVDYTGPDAFTYYATDALGATSATVAVTLVVNPMNDNPVAVLGVDQVVEDQDGNGSEAVILDGAASYHPDPEDHIVAWRWRLGATLLASNAASRVILPVGVHQVFLEVEDQAGHVGQASLTITVKRSAVLLPGLYGEYFVLGGTPTAIPDLVPLVPDWVRVDPAIDFPAADVPWQELPAGTAQGFAARWSGTVDVPVAGNWTFATTSADGSRLYLDETLLVDNDGLHGMTRQSGSRTLAAGRHALRVEYFHRTGQAGCVVSWQPPNGTEVTIPGTALAHANAAPVARDMALVFSQRVAPYGIDYFYLDVQDAESPLRDALDCVIVRPLAHSSLGFPFLSTHPYGSYRLRFVPDPSWVGTDSFTFQATDPQGRVSRLATCTITVVSNSAPVAKDMSLVLIEGTVSKTFTLAATDQDDSSNLLVPILVAAPVHGTVTLGASVADSCTYQPTPGYVGTDSFAFQVHDPQGLLSATGTCAIAIRPNAVPVAQNQTVVGYRELGTPGRKLLFTDPDPQSWTFAVVAGPSHGSLSAFSSNAGTFTYKPNSGYTGNDAFTWRVSDGLATSSPATVSIVLRDPASRQGDLVQLVVDERVRVPLAAEIGRLRDDLVNEGYTAEIVPWPAASTVAALWNHLRTVWTDPARPLVGAILIGSLPQPISERSKDGLAPDDLVYWNLRTFDLGSPERFDRESDTIDYQIWVSRIGVEDLQWGDEVTLIRRALDANHAYRTGRSRLPHTAYAYSAFNNIGGTFMDYYPEQLLEIWPAMLCHTESEFGGGGSGVHRARFLPTRMDLDDSAADALVAAGEIFVEDSHGIKDAYMAGAFSTQDLYRYINQQRFVLASSCVSGAPGGVINNHIFTRGGGCVYALGTSVPSQEGTFVLFQRDRRPGTLGPVKTRCRSLLARRESWGRSLLDSYYMRVNSKTIHYGDLSMPVKASPANAMPDIVSFTKTPATVYPGQPVTFSVAVTDPDGAGEKSPHVPFRHQVEWFMNGYNSGRNNPTYVTDNTQGAGWTNKTHVFTSPGTYVVRAEVMDEWQARGWREMTVTVNAAVDSDGDGIPDCWM